MAKHKVEDYVEFYTKEGIAGDHQARMRRGGFHQFLAHRIEQATQSCQPKDMLDVGCAEGRYIFSYPGLRTGIGVDLSEAKLKRAVALASQTDKTRTLFIMADAHNLPFPDESFDLVVCSQVLEHLRDPDAAVRELARVARSHVIISVPAWSVMTPFGFGSPYKSRDYLLKRDGHIQWFTAGKLRKLALRSGLRPLRLEPISCRYPFRRLLARLPGVARLWLSLDSLAVRFSFLSPFAYRIMLVCSKASVERPH